MASAGFRSLTRTAVASVRSCLARSRGVAPAASLAAPASPSHARRLPWLCRSPVELGCCSGSLLPLQSAAAAARLSSRLSSISRSCRALSQESTKVAGTAAQ